MLRLYVIVNILQLIRRLNKIPVICSDFDCDKCMFRVDGNCSRYLLKEWAESEYIEKPVISKKDRAFLEYINKYKYITRDSNTWLYVYSEKPSKSYTFWNVDSGKSLCFDSLIEVDFPMVKWSDSEPWLIEDLKKLEVVEEYEK